mmetsp:Transcript_871/g.1057  ORF Transcript_871/g.1057 Transcript_871/m.1057 type:complete len:266 (+) Transcript_871:326-1123(+)|eukprot:CAMPEP_0184024328 /NCGR_PEP_ID=MMETSP0954-20121128/12005_1 /TAXON_ID=627963 /ORGANISM="Aplanochytrium sp, Strain PBS07" /LENGTH=265 /DNA_ID=CAMNT_0026307611 /DNA_START=407 /DNA_END=1204 /DNA_ORIENTATION=-
MSCSTAFLKFIHTLVFIIGAAIFGLSIATLVTGNQYFPTDDNVGTSYWFAWVPFAFGIVLMLGAILGCIFTKPGNCCFLGTYGIIQFVIGVIIIISGAFILASITITEEIVDSNAISNGLDPDTAQPEVSDFMLGLYEGCCSTPEIPNCPTNITQGDKTFCYLNPSTFQSGVDSAIASNNTYCVYDPFQAACDQQDIQSFLVANHDWLKDNLFPGGVAIVVFGSLLFFASCCSCYVGCKSDEEKAQPPQPAHSQLQTNQQGVQLA